MVSKFEGLLGSIIVAVLFVVFPALTDVDQDTLSHPAKWLVSLAVAVVVAVGVAGYAWLKANYSGAIVLQSPIVKGSNAEAPDYSTSPTSLRPVATAPLSPSPSLPDGWDAITAKEQGSGGAQGQGSGGAQALTSGGADGNGTTV